MDGHRDASQPKTMSNLPVQVYNNGKVAVEDLSLNFYEGQITSFLGKHVTAARRNDLYAVCRISGECLEYDMLCVFSLICNRLP